MVLSFSNENDKKKLPTKTHTERHFICKVFVISKLSQSAEFTVWSRFASVFFSFFGLIAPYLFRFVYVLSLSLEMFTLLSAYIFAIMWLRQCVCALRIIVLLALLVQWESNYSIDTRGVIVKSCCCNSSISLNASRRTHTRSHMWISCQCHIYLKNIYLFIFLL